MLRASVRKENGPVNNNSFKRAVNLRKTGSPNSRGGRTAILDSSPTSPSAGAKEGLNTQMLNAAVIPCTITLNVPADRGEEFEGKKANSEEENDTVERRDGDGEAGRRSGRDDGGRNRGGFMSKGDEPHEGGFVRREEELEERPQRVVVTATDGKP